MLNWLEMLTTKFGALAFKVAEADRTLKKWGEILAKKFELHLFLSLSCVDFNAIP